MICKNCNREIPNDREYCSFCGNVVESAILSNDTTDLNKGYTYLELKQWDDAEQFFRDAIINGENKAEAYIGKMLSRYKSDSIEGLVASGRKFSSDDDFKLALKYADGEYADYLKESVLNAKSKTKKRTVIVSSVCACVIVIALLSYFVIIPLNRISDYKSLLSDGKAPKAVKSYQSSKWFEYDKKAKDLFYENGLKFVENKDYKNAEVCFEITNGYTDNEKYLNYCKAQLLMNDNDIAAYNYFVKCKGFLNVDEILNTHKRYEALNKLQGKWYYPGKTLEERDTEMLANGYIINSDETYYIKKSEITYLDKGYCYSPSAAVKRENIDEETVTVTGIIWGSENEIFIGDNEIYYIDFKDKADSKIEIIDDTHIKIDHKEYTKQSNS